MRHLMHDPPPVRIAVIEALGKSEDPRVKDVLFRCLGETDPEIQRAAMLALARIPGDDVFERLLGGAASDRLAPARRRRHRARRPRRPRGAADAPSRARRSRHVRAAVRGPGAGPTPSPGPSCRPRCCTRPTRSPPTRSSRAALDAAGPGVAEYFTAPQAGGVLRLARHGRLLGARPLPDGVLSCAGSSDSTCATRSCTRSSAGCWRACSARSSSAARTRRASPSTATAAAAPRATPRCPCSTPPADLAAPAARRAGHGGGRHHGRRRAGRRRRARRRRAGRRAGRARWSAPAPT